MSYSAPPVSRANFFSSLSTYKPRNVYRVNNCNNTLCFTYNHNYVYHAHTGYGKVGTIASSYRAQRRRL